MNRNTLTALLVWALAVSAHAVDDIQSHEPLLPEAQEAIDPIADFMRSSLPKQ